MPDSAANGHWFMKRSIDKNQFRQSRTSSRRRSCLRLCFCLILVLCVGSSCKRKQNPSTSRAPAELDQATRSYLRLELQRPNSFGGWVESDFVRNTYKPGLENALHSLNDLEAGKVDVVPVAAFVRPYAGHTALWMMWLQLDAGKRSVSLYDEKGEFAAFSAPAPASPSPGYNYLRFSVIRLVTSSITHQSARDGPTLNILTTRPFDIRAIRIVIHAPEGDQKRKPTEMPAVYYPLETAATTRSTDGNAE